MQVTSYKSPCHLIFEKCACNFYVTTHDVNLEVDAESYRGKAIISDIRHSRRTIIDHDEYISCIQAYVNQGWDLAGIIHMENISKSVTYNTSNRTLIQKFYTTIKLIFQAPAGEESAGGIL